MSMSIIIFFDIYDLFVQNECFIHSPFCANYEYLFWTKISSTVLCGIMRIGFEGIRKVGYPPSSATTPLTSYLPRIFKKDMLTDPQVF